MNVSRRIPASTSVVRRGLLALALLALVSLAFALPGGARAARPSPAAASTAKVKGRFDRLLVKGVDSGLLVRGSLLPGSGHGNARVVVFLRQGKAQFKRSGTIRLSSDDRNFAFLDHISPGVWDVKLSFVDPAHVLTATSPAKQVTVTPIFGHPIVPGSVTVSNGNVTYTGSFAGAKSATVMQLLALNTGPIASTTHGPVHTPAHSFSVVASTLVGTGTGKVAFTLHAKLKQGQRWTLLLQRNYGHKSGIDYAGLKTVRVP